MMIGCRSGGQRGYSEALARPGKASVLLRLGWVGAYTCGSVAREGIWAAEAVARDVPARAGTPKHSCPRIFFVLTPIVGKKRIFFGKAKGIGYAVWADEQVRGRTDGTVSGARPVVVDGLVRGHPPPPLPSRPHFSLSNFRSAYIPYIFRI